MLGLRWRYSIPVSSVAKLPYVPERIGQYEYFRYCDEWEERQTGYRLQQYRDCGRGEQ